MATQPEGKFRSASEPKTPSLPSAPGSAMVSSSRLQLPSTEGGVVSVRAFTWRAFFIGLLGSVFIAIGDQYGINVIKGSYMGLDFTTPAAIFLLFFVTMPFNSLLRAISKRLALTTQELALSFIMFTIACSLSTMGLGAQLLPIISAASYYARTNPEWGWQDKIVPYLPAWAVPQDKEAIRAFFEKVGEEPRVEWQAWVEALVCWAPFLLMLYFVMIAISVLLRRQWVEHERLVFPLSQLPIEAVQCDEHRFIAPFFRNRMLWLGFAVPMLIGTMIALHNYYPTIPSPVLVSSLALFRQTTSLVFRLSFPMLGFFYLVHLDMAFSLWFFNILAFILRGLINIEFHPALAALNLREAMGIYGSPFTTYKHLGTGAIITLVLVGLWNAREHLKRVARKSLFFDRSIDDRDENLSYPVAFWGTLLGTVGMAVWLYLSGIPIGALLVFLFYLWVFFIGLARIVAESGLGEAVAPSIAPDMTISTLGVPAIGNRGLVALGLTYVWCSDIRTYVMASAIHGMKIATALRMNRRALFWAMFVAAIVTLVVANATLMVLGYKHGGVTLNSWFFIGGPQAPYKYIMSKLSNPEGPSIPSWWVRGLGAAIMFALMIARRQLSWFPFHPLGFCVSTIWLMDQIWLTCFIAWVLKGVILRYGGMSGFYNARPFFLGLILGQFTCNATWLIIDYFTGKVGNMVFWI